MRQLAAGNWKMNGVTASLSEIEALKQHLKAEPANCDVMICPPATLVMACAEAAAGSPIQVGGQDCHAKTSGAHTGDVSAQMLADAGATAVIVGHSERRADHGETNEQVRAKAEAAHAAGLMAVICLGETLKQREAGETLAVVHDQLQHSLPTGATGANTVIAYEPVWAIGTGRSATPQDAAEVHAEIRRVLGEMRGEEEAAGTLILYGGSVKPGNAAELLALEDIDGALVGGASLKAEDFWGIARACP